MTPLGSAINVLATGDEPDHGPARKLVAPHFTAGHLAALEHGLDSVMDRLWSDCVARAQANDGSVEWMSLVGDRLPMTLVARVIGLPDDDVEQIIALSYESADLLNGLLSVDGDGAARRGRGRAQRVPARAAREGTGRSARRPARRVRTARARR